jgi:O-antigen/teichoic acid export membrane protein
MKIAMIANMVLFTVITTATPKFAQLYEKDFKNFKQVVSKSTKLIFWGTLPIVLFIVLFDRFVLSLFGDDLEPARYAMLILVMGQFFSSISGSVVNIMKITGAHRTMQKFLFLVFALNIVLNYVLIPRYGIEGAALATAGSTILLNLLCVVYIFKRDRLLTIYLPLLTAKLNRRLSR